MAWLRRDLPILLTVVTVGAVLRVARVGFDSLTLDELWHLELSTGRGSPHLALPTDTLVSDAPAVTSLNGAPPFWAVWRRMDRVLHPPLYCTALRLWRDVFGEGDASARAFSIVCSLAVIVLLYEVARRLHGRAVAAWASALLAVAPTQVWLAQQVRGYQMLQALGLCGVLALLRLERGTYRRGAVIWFGAILLAMMLTHYFALGACAAMGLYAVTRLRGSARRDALIAAGVAAVVFAVVWGPFLLRQKGEIAEMADMWLVEHVSDHVPLTASRAVVAPWRLFADVMGSSLLPLLAGLVLIVPPVLLFVRKRSDLLIWCLWLLGTLGLLIVLDLARGTKHLVFPRYYSLATPAVFAVTIASVSTQRWGRWIVHTLGAAGTAAGLALAGHAYTSEEPDWRGLSALGPGVAPGEAIVFAAGTKPGWYNAAYYLAAAHYARVGWPRPVVILSDSRASPELIASLPGRSAWLVSGPMPRPIPELLPGCRPIYQESLRDDSTLLTRLSLPAIAKK